jgi:hypothetical protein
MSEHKHDLRRGSTIVVVIEGDGEFRGYYGTALGHDGQFTVTKAKVPSGENFAQGDGGGFLVASGVNYYTDLPHGDAGQGKTWVWPDELPAGFYVG